MDKRGSRNAVLNITGEALWGFMWNMIAPAAVLTVLLTQYGAGGGVIGAISAIEGAAMLLPQVLGVYLFHSARHRKARLILCHIVVMLPLILGMSVLTFAADHMQPALYRAAMLACFAAFSLMVGVVSAAWMDFLGHVFDVKIRGTVIGVSIAGASLAGTLGALTAGWIIKTLPAPGAYALLYLAAWLLGTLSISMWFFVSDPGRDRAPTAPPRFAALVARFRHSLEDLNFRRFLIGRILATCGFCIIPFFAVHYTAADGGGLSKTFVVSAFSALTAGMALGGLVLGWVGDRHGHRLGILTGAGAQVVTLLVVLLIPGRAGCVLTYAGAGVCAAAGFVSHYNLILETCPHDNRIAHISIANLLIGLPLAVVPVLAGFAAEAWGRPTLFRICLALSAVAFLWIVFRVREPRSLQLAEAE